MVYSTTLEGMWLTVWGNSLIGSLALLATFAYLCYRRKYGIVETLYVMFPVIVGVTVADYLPQWVRGIFIMGIGGLWGLALTKTFNSLEPYTKIYLVFLGMNLALTLSGYSLAAYTYLSSGDTMDLANESRQYPSGTSATGFMEATGAVKSIAVPLVDFFLGGGVIGLLIVSGLPSEVVSLVGYPIGFLALLAILPLLRMVWELIKAILDATVGTIAKFIGR